MLDAAAEGLIDFSKARLLDGKWWRRSRIVIDALERRGRAKIADASLRYHLSLVANGGLTKESFEKAQDTAKERFFDLIGCFRPWDGRDYQERQVNEVAAMRQLFIDMTGADPFDPKFKEWEAEQIAKAEAERLADQVQDPEDALRERLMRHHDERSKR